MKDELNLPDIPEDYRFNIIPTKYGDGMTIKLQRRYFGFWKTVGMGYSSTYPSIKSATELRAHELWQSWEEESRYADEAERLSGIYGKAKRR